VPPVRGIDIGLKTQGTILLIETITYAKNGQWSLDKTKENHQAVDADFLSYKNMDREGSLPKNYGQRGTLHGNPPGRSHQMSDNKLKGKTTIATRSQQSDTHPGASGGATQYVRLIYADL
jgi:hypothetical protein